jgi:8-oxo-dGTP diphosphatase
MLHRIKRPGDMHAGKWNGLGGKLEAGETPEECAVREVEEESGLRIEQPRWRGLITFPQFKDGVDWYTFIYVAERFSGDLIDCREGDLAWVDDAHLLGLPLWEGDRIFIPWLDREEFFSAKFTYAAGELTKYRVVFYTPGHATGPETWERVPASSQGDATVRLGYRPEDDLWCWICGAAVEKRHCKLICAACGFTRDCSDP